MTSPALTAMMCDGLGVFSDLDFKRALLLYDSILYLLPEHLVRFPGITGKPQSLLYPLTLADRQEFVVHHFTPPPAVAPLLTAAARSDIGDPGYAAIIAQLSEGERLYAWSVVNCDGDLGGGTTLALPPEQAPLAQAILLNKFLLAADAAGCVPIAGREYVDHLLGAKYRLAAAGLDALAQATGTTGAAEDARHFAIARAVVAHLVPDAELEKRSWEEIRAFKHANYDLFQRFSLALRRFAQDISALPATREFDRDVADLLATDVWEAQRELEGALRSRWTDMFRGALDEGVRSDAFRPAVHKVLTALAVGVLPTLTLGPLSVASAVAGLTAASPWLIQTALDYLGKRRDIRRHGLYYLHAFARA